MQWIGGLAIALAPALAFAGEADVLKATARQSSDGAWTVSATVRHDDTGWDHYADAFQVLTPEGRELGIRVLLHPHETEQPFTRSLSGIAIPKDVDEIVVRARDKVHGYGGKEARVKLPR